MNAAPDWWLHLSFQYYAWRIATALLGRLPLRVCYAIATAAGTVAFEFWPRGRRNTLRNFRRVLRCAPPSEVRRVAHASLVNYCKYLVDFIRFPAMDAAALRTACHGDEQFAQLDAALARGRGVIFVPMHFGNWDMGAGAAAARGYRPAVVVESFADPRLDRMVFAARERLGVDVLRMERLGPSLIRRLKANGVVALLIDRPQTGQGVVIDFFGSPIEVPSGPARLALRTGATVIPVAFPRIDPDRSDVAVLAEFLVPGPASGDATAAVQQLTQLIVSAHERFIHRYPEQWYMFREMWPRKTQDRQV